VKVSDSLNVPAVKTESCGRKPRIVAEEAGKGAAEDHTESDERRWSVRVCVCVRRGVPGGGMPVWQSAVIQSRRRTSFPRRVGRASVDVIQSRRVRGREKRRWRGGQWRPGAKQRDADRQRRKKEKGRLQVHSPEDKGYALHGVVLKRGARDALRGVVPQLFVVSQDSSARRRGPHCSECICTRS
jgi:hypothetical protein